MSSLLDTDILWYYLDDIPQAVELVGSLIPQGVALSIIAYIELYQGTLRTSDPAHGQDRLEALLALIPMLPLTPEVARRCARLHLSVSAFHADPSETIVESRQGTARFSQTTGGMN